MTAFYEWVSEASLWWWPRFADHLWQTTLFVFVVSVAAFALRRGPARVRHNFWLLASAKFIVPAVLFVFLAQQAGIDSLPIFHSTPAAEQSALLVTGVTEPASTIALDYEVTVVADATDDHKQVYLALTAVWLAGGVGLVFVWAIRRRRFLRSLKLGRRLQTGREWQALERAKTTLGLQSDVGLVISPLKIEPAAWRVWRPLVVMPESIAHQLDDEELEAIMLHELVHIQRRDNLIGNLQLAICTLLWFHPLVWFISRRLFDEREQACDERVMEVCGAPEAYASSILKVVRFCFGWKMAGVTGAAGGSNLRRRIENIMTIGNTKRGTGAASALLAGALVGIALLVLVGAGVYSKAQGRNSMANDTEVASVQMGPSGDTEVAFSLANVLGWNTQKAKRVMPPPPPPAPAQPAQPAQPPKTSQPVMPPPPTPVESAQPAQAPQAPQPPQPTQASSVPNPVQVPDTLEIPQQPPPPEPVQVPRSSHQLPASAGGKGGATGDGRGVGVAASAPVPTSSSTIRPGVATGIGRGGGVSVAGSASGTGAYAPRPAVATGVRSGVGVSVAGSASGTGASASRPGVATGIGQGVGGGVGGAAASPAPSSIAPASAPEPAPASPGAVPAPRAEPAKQQKSKPRSKEKVEKGASRPDRVDIVIGLIEAPQPVYPADAKEQKIEGVVRVAVVIDESGKVISARAKSGPDQLKAASQEAAYKARFKPTKIDGEVAATVSYNFVLSKR